MHSTCSVPLCTFIWALSVQLTQRPTAKKSMITVWPNVASFHIALCTFSPGHSRYPNRKAVFLCLPVYSAGNKSQIVQSWIWHGSDGPPDCGCHGSLLYAALLVLIPGITMFQYKSTVHSVFLSQSFLWAFICDLSAPFSQEQRTKLKNEYL